VGEGRVFIVDDRPDEIQVLGSLLRENGYEVHLATTGRHALEAIPEMLPELVMVDHPSTSSIPGSRPRCRSWPGELWPRLPWERPGAAELEAELRATLPELPADEDAPAPRLPGGDQAPGGLTLGSRLGLDWYADADEATTMERPAPPVDPEGPTRAAPRPGKTPGEARPETKPSRKRARRT
jgi:hypothetical protein